MLAIPVFRSRVAPVLNWCSRVFIISENAANSSQSEEILFANISPFELLRYLQDKGVSTVICGALTPDLLSYGQQLGMKIICGVAGQIDEVLHAYHVQGLDEPRFWLPGCRGQRGYRKHCGKWGGLHPQDERRQTMPGGKGKGQGGRGENRRGGGGRTPQPGVDCGLRRGMRAGGLGPGTEQSCVCLQCGTEVLHERGIPCAQRRCPECDQPMVRKQ